MAPILLILPSSLKNNEVLNEHLQNLDGLYKGEKDSFYYEDGNVLELKKRLAGQSYETVVVCFPSITSEFPEIQVVRSLSSKSILVLYCPDIGFIKNKRAGNGTTCDLFRWRDMGCAIQKNMCLQADMIIADSEADRNLLERELARIPVYSVEQLRSGTVPAPVKRSRGKVSIVILTFNQIEDTRRCVESLEKHTEGIDYELVFVDNGSTDETRAYLESLSKTGKNVRVLLNDRNLGFAKANNQGMQVATGDYLLLLNNDVVLTDSWLDRLLACAESDPQIGVVGPCTNHAVGQQVVSVELDLNDKDIQRFAGMQALKNAGYWFQTHRIIGFCMLMRKEVIDRIGMLDERFGPGGFEDYDFCLRVNQAGYKILVASDVFVYHIGGKGYSGNNLDYDKLRTQNVHIFIEKWCRRALKILESMPNGM